DGTTVTQNVDPTWNGGDICIQNGGVLIFRAGRAIRVFHVTGVQTCALPISVVKILAGATLVQTGTPAGSRVITTPLDVDGALEEIGRASCRERVKTGVDAVSFKVKGGASIMRGDGRQLTATG